VEGHAWSQELLLDCRTRHASFRIGEVIARPRAWCEEQDPGSRAYASAGLPGAEWWVADSACGAPHSANVELDDVYVMYTDNDLWSAVFDSNR
jgi:hypothetical protein